MAIALLKFGSLTDTMPGMIFSKKQKLHQGPNIIGL